MLALRVNCIRSIPCEDSCLIRGLLGGRDVGEKRDENAEIFITNSSCKYICSEKERETERERERERDEFEA